MFFLHFRYKIITTFNVVYKTDLIVKVENKVIKGCRFVFHSNKILTGIAMTEKESLIIKITFYSNVI